MPVEAGEAMGGFMGDCEVDGWGGAGIDAEGSDISPLYSIRDAISWMFCRYSRGDLLF
jgi:hypothetical protein